MGVYIAERKYDYDGFEIIGVFSTREKAQEACDNDLRTEYGGFYGIEVFEVDA